ncbi:hypothetical protein GEMRC1_008208 [Eukaryota sp. GEM-RC1]
MSGLYSLQKSFDLFKELIIKHSVQRPPFSIAFFSHFDVQNITKFFTDTYFKYYDMYKHVFIPTQFVELHCCYSTIQPQFSPPTIPPLTEATLVQPEVIEQQEEEPSEQQDVPEDQPEEESLKPEDEPVENNEGEENDEETAQDVIKKALDDASDQIKQLLADQFNSLSLSLDEIKKKSKDN